MNIKSVRLENFRSYLDETVIFDDYTCFVGPNGAGKSTVLSALNLFFGESQGPRESIDKLYEDDFHNRDIKKPVKITVTFTDLSEKAKIDLKDYFRQNELIVSAVGEYDPELGYAPIKQYGHRKAMKKFAEFFKALKEGAPVKNLKEIYGILRTEFPDLPVGGTKDNLIQSLNEYESNHPELCEIIPSEDQFYGVSKGRGLLVKYIQWVYVPAVKDISAEQLESRGTFLSKLLALTVRNKIDFTKLGELQTKAVEEYKNILSDADSELKEISASLGEKLAVWAHPNASINLEWIKDEEAVRVDEPQAQILTRENGFSGPLNKFGQGLQRSYLLAILQEISEIDNEFTPNLILGCEEPELYQHPLQAKHLATVLDDLSGKKNQIIISTHSPYFISGRNFRSVRLVRRNTTNNSSFIKRIDIERLRLELNRLGYVIQDPNGAIAKINQELQPSINEIFFAPIVILVEGPEDLAYLTSYLQLSGKMKDFRKYGCQIIPANGKNHFVWLISIMGQMEIPFYAIFDSDSDSKPEDLIKHKRDNEQILSICEVESPSPFPEEDLIGPNFAIWKNELSNSILSGIPLERLSQIDLQARKECGHIKNISKNSLYIGELMSLLWAEEYQFAGLDKLCNSILVFAEKNSAT